MMLSALKVDWKRLWRSAMLAGVLGTGVRVGANLLLLPVVLIKLSSSELALWYVFMALGGFANLADFGFGSTMARIYNYLFAGAEDFEAEGLREAKAGGDPNFAGINRLNATVRSLYLKISLGAMVLLAIGGTIFLLKPAAESGIAQRVWWFWAAYIVAIGYNLATSHWVQAVAGLNRMRDQQFAYALGSLTYICCAALLLICHLGLLSMVVATFARGFMMHGRCHQIYRQVVPKPEHPARPDARIVRKLWPNASKFGVLAIGGYCLSSGGVLICSQLLGPEVTASFGLTTQIGNFMMNLAVIWLAVKWPEVAILRAQGRLEEMAVLFARRLGLAVVSFVGMALITLAAGNVLLAWKGTHTRLLATPYLAFYLVYVMQQVIYQQFSILVYTENVVPFFKISIYTGLAAITLSLAMTPPFGLWGLLIAPFVAEMACNCWYTVRRGFQGQPLTPRKFALAALGGWD